jgi:hypothetical protein
LITTKSLITGGEVTGEAKGKDGAGASLTRVDIAAGELAAATVGDAAGDAAAATEGDAAGDPAPPGGRSAPLRGAALAICAAVVLVPLALVVTLRLDRLVVTSDSVAQQSILLTWFRAGHDLAYLPPDTWLLKLPVYAVIEALPLSPSGRLRSESLTLDVIAFVLLGLGAWWLARSWRPVDGGRALLAVALPLAWVGTVGGGLGQYLAVMPNSRNIELGLSLCVVAASGLYLRGDRGSGSGSSCGSGLDGRRISGRRIATGVVLAALIGVLWVDDPYFALLVGLPLAACSLLWYRLRDRDARLVRLAVVLVGSLAAVPVLRQALRAVGVVVVPDATGVTLSPRQILHHLPVLWPSLAAQLGLSEPGILAGLAHALALVVLVPAVVASGYLAGRGWRERRLAVTFAAVHWPVVVVGVLVNRTIYDYHAGRYLVLAVFDLAVCLSVATASLMRLRPRLATVVGALVAAAVVANGAAAVLDRAPRPAQADLQRDTLALLRTTGATKGFGEFWAADLYTQLSGGELMVSDVVCQDGRLHLRHWLTDSARSRVPARRTFLLWDPSAPGSRGCGAAQLVQQFGSAEDVQPAPTGGSVWVFASDVADRLGPVGDRG